MTLRALREDQGWSTGDLARELRRTSPDHERSQFARDLPNMVWQHEHRHEPSPLYMRAYRRVFPELAVLDQARRITADPGLDVLARAAATVPGLADIAGRLAELRQQIADNAERLRKQLAQVEEERARMQGLIAESRKYREGGAR